MRLASLDCRELRRRLRDGSLTLSVGRFDIALQSDLPQLARGVETLYGEYPLARATALIDFAIELRAPGALRRWWRPQVQFALDGRSPFKPLPQSQAFAMFEWGLNWCIANHAHDCLVVHAAVVARGDAAVILPGAPGSGKSTLCAALVSRGWRLLSDEMALISLHDGRLVPVPRPISLKNASIDIIRRQFPAARLGGAVHDTSKGTVAHMCAPRDSIEAAAETARPVGIVFPRYSAAADLEFVAVTRGEALMKVAGNAFNYNVLGATGFELLADTVEQCSRHALTYSDLDAAIAQVERIFAHV